MLRMVPKLWVELSVLCNFQANNIQTNAAFLSYVNSAVAYINSTNIFGAGAEDFKNTILSQLDSSAAAAGTDETVVAGYKAIYETTVNKIFSSPVGQIELLIGNNLNGSINIGACIQHPFSHGQISINSSNPMDYPLINPNYLTHPAGKLFCWWITHLLTNPIE